MSRAAKHAVSIQPSTLDAYKLFHDGTLALARAERQGICIDVDYCQKAQTHITRQIDRLRRNFQDSDLVRLWRDVYGGKMNLNSDDQLSHILFKEMKLTAPKSTGTGKAAVDQESLESLDIPELQEYLRIRKLEKCRDTYIKNFLDEQVGGVMHTSFNLNLVRTYRSSSSDPNIQNIPNRDPEIKKWTRQAIIPRPGRKLLCGDFKGIEVGVAACYHLDPAMIAYVSDKSKDMHRDMAMEIFMLSQDQVVKMVRHTSKNKFVFPQFYGDWWKSCAEAIWAASGTDTHKTKDGVPLREHLANKGIKDLGKCDLSQKKSVVTGFYKHLQQVEDRFWNERFLQYTQWKEDWVKEYQKKGYFITKTGFKCQGVMRKNEAINYPVQGSAFHCLLQCLIWMDAWLMENNMDSRVIGQIHDELILDVHPKEECAVTDQMRYLMTEKLPQHWKWIVVPMEVELEGTEVDGSWYTKSPEHTIPF